MFKPARPIKVGVLGATGAVGQRFLQCLDGHPWFEVTALGASGRNVGKKYGAVPGWRLSSDVPKYVRDIELVEGEPGKDWDCEIIFSSLPSDIAGETEERFAAAGYKVFSNARNHRTDPDVPLMIPEVNPDHSSILRYQQQQRGWDKGFIITNPNCTTIHLVLALKPLQDAFGLKKVLVTSMQSLSGAGYPGVSALDIVDNVIPFIDGEESKVESEPLKLLGQLVESNTRFVDAEIAISATCTRVAVREAHTETVSVELGRKTTLHEVAEVLQNFQSEPQRLQLPNAPINPVLLRHEHNRPQPFLDREGAGAMATTVGRLRHCSILDYKFVLVGHNTIRGAAAASILNAELLTVQGYVGN
ncbi:MAG: aspartate-semialdehyde dehydrogenase [Chloroflexi bacterium]|uniref:Aspartate-semialdehyde dehydrogenase n=1 Tax=Candidatus Chlorohelix allophototropha TaxID=3003348 RepID=A0A8T7M0B0_9CHLR|nr:aspartate-semialdehyde dehydrogenase [Chloroflexota bacterium]WJW66645.1 aspartate-semialdehyde dehydrogenase [Chloroflexota bacterium L227-S17]